MLSFCDSWYPHSFWALWCVSNSLSEVTQLLTTNSTQDIITMLKTWSERVLNTLCHQHDAEADGLKVKRWQDALSCELKLQLFIEVVWVHLRQEVADSHLLWVWSSVCKRIL